MNSTSTDSPIADPSATAPNASPTTTGDVMEDVQGNSYFPLTINEEETTAHLLKTAKENVDKLRVDYKVAYGHYLSCQKHHPNAEPTRVAYLSYKEAEVLFREADEAYKIFYAMENPVKIDNKSHLVPTILPFLQLKTDTELPKKNKEIFDSVYDFCNQFKTVLEAHSLNLDDHWERLLPMCLNKEDKSWFEEKLKNKCLSWKEVETKILDHFDTPYRQFLLMFKVWTLKQGPKESTRLFASKFQTLRRQAGIQDGLSLVLTFWAALRESVRNVASVTVSSHYGTKLPDKVEDIIGLVLASTNDTDMFSPTWNSDSNASKYAGENNYERTRKRTAPTKVNKDFKSNKTMLNSSPSSKKPCFYCSQPWYHGHRCEEFVEAKNKKTKISRMAVRSLCSPGNDVTASDKEEEDDEDSDMLMARLALDCKSKDKDVVKKDFKNISTNITFPVLVNNTIRTMSLLDCGATFSSVDKQFCLSNNIHIDYIKHVNKDLANKSNMYKYLIKLADNNSYVKRIGTCILNISCNNKTIKHNFEVMNLTQTNEYHMSIGTDCMSALSIGIYGLPTNYDDQNTLDEILEADKRFNNTSQLLEELKEENEKKENNPACDVETFQQVMDFIQPSIDRNQSIPKGSFCTIPESVVHLDTPPNVTAYKKPYPVPLTMMQVVDDQVKEWFENGIIEKATANTEWNTPLTVVKKTDGKGEITGYRVCHDPRHINVLLKSIDRMPLPIIGELFEELQGANVYSTLDLKSAFNSLRLNPSDAHKLSFTWRGVQYKPIGTVFGIKHVSSQFQRTMSIALADMPFVRYFVDDIVCASKTIEEHKEHLKQVIQRLTKVNLKLNPKKCHFFQAEINLLGFHISPKGISMDRRKLANVLEFPEPKTGKDIMRYCGLINYFRNLIPHVATIMAPLDALRNEKSLETIWNATHQRAFENLKKALLGDIVLAYPDMNARFCIACDASSTGIGAVLYQKIDGKTKYISFIAKALSKSERNYSATKRELLALVFSLKRFHKYIYGSTFTLFTDHKALTFLHTQRIANLMMIAWMDTILQYDFRIVHLPGISNVLPDVLSRLYEDVSTVSNELGGDKAIMINPAVNKESFPAFDNNEYFIPATKKERHELLLHEHSKGHFGAEALMNALKRQGIYWTKLKEDAIELIKACIQCQRHNITQKGYNPLRPVLATLPGDSWGIDLASPFTTSTRGNEYLLVMIDIASKFHFLRAIPDKSAATVAIEILNVICTFGPMRKLQSDHGTEFVNSLIATLKKHIGFEHALISQYHPRGNGASERAVQSAVKTIKKQINGNVAEWDCMVGPTQLFLNSKYNIRTKSTPFSLMFGRNPNDFENFSQEKDKPTSERINEELQNKLKFMTEIVYPAVYEQVKRVTNKQKEKFDTKHKIMDIPINATVMILVTDKQNKLDPHYKGFYKVINKTLGGSYVLKNEKGFIEPRNYPPSLLKVVSDKIMPEDEKYYEVEAIIGHKKDEQNNYLYRCRWLNYDESEDSWEPAENFSDPKFMTEYWKRIGEIPEGIKAVNKANKKLLKELSDQKTQLSRNPSKRKRLTPKSTDQHNSKIRRVQKI